MDEDWVFLASDSSIELASSIRECLLRIKRDQAEDLGLKTFPKSEDSLFNIVKIISAVYSDGEINLSIERSDVLGKNVILVHSFLPLVNTKFVELLLIIDAAQRAGANKIFLFISYLGYARQDKLFINNSTLNYGIAPLSAKIICSSIAGIERVFVFDCHSQQISGFFGVPFHNIELSGFCGLLGLREMVENNRQLAFSAERDNLELFDMISSLNLCIVAPDSGAFNRARHFARSIKMLFNSFWGARMDIPVVVINKHRSAPGVSEVFESSGDVTGMDCVIVDDIIDSAGTICNASLFLKNKRAKSVRAIISHGVLSGGGIDKVNNCNSLDMLAVADSIQRASSDKIKIFSIAYDVAMYISAYIHI